MTRPKKIDLEGIMRSFGSRFWLISVFLFIVASVSLSNVSAQSIDVREGFPCQLIPTEAQGRIDRLYVLNKKTQTLESFKCVRNDTKPTSSGGFWSCGSKVAKKFLIKRSGPECVWKKSINAKTKKPIIFEYNSNVGASCMDGDARIASFLNYVRDGKLVTLSCRGGVWVSLGDNTDLVPIPASTPNPSKSIESKVNSESLCNNFANAIIAYSRTAKYATSMFEMQLVNRQLTQATSALQDLVRRDRSLDPLNTAIGILIRHVQAQGPGGSGIPVNGDVLRIAVDSFNGYCGTSIYIS